MPHLHLHLVSDSTGETLISVARAVMAQFEDVSATEHVSAFVRSRRQLDEIMTAVKKTHGIILFTLVDKEVREELQDRCDDERITCISVLGPVISALGSYLGLEGRGEPGRQHMVNAEYFRRIAAMNFAIAHDDGHLSKDLPNADMILVGVSRTSKTPTCAYLANRGYKVANIPIVAGIPVPEELYDLKKPLIVGLTINPDRLIEIRKNRLLTLHDKNESDYVDMGAIKEELTYARRLFAKRGWPVIDVTRRSIEETAAAIVNLHNRRLLEAHSA
ncbi:MAG TPA: pyruvate, water dikinase regulatory protein [Alphaproteobacteria bacterium]|nr:pyruvate, water dikinase regulatory protein [Alphaproteobacteria bacterium]